MTGAGHTVAFLGLGAMGAALASAQLGRGRRVVVWNRTPSRRRALVARGAIGADTPGAAVRTGDPVVVCLYDHASVRETLAPVAAALRGRTVVNLTTTTPEQARELATWAARHGIGYLDGAVMAVPSMIGSPGARILYSGAREVFDAHRELFDAWAVSSFEGADPGAASLLDLAMLSGMYSMFTGFLHGVAMVQAAGHTAAGFAERAAPFLAAMTDSFAMAAETLDRRDYSQPQQSLDWTITILDTIGRASREHGISPVSIDVVTALAAHQIDAGHGADDFHRILETMRSGPPQGRG